MDTSSFGILEFDRILGLISAYASCPATAQETGRIRPFDNKDDILQRQGQLNELLRMASEGDPVRLSAFPDISVPIDRAKPEGAVLDASELALFIPVFRVSSAVSQQIGSMEFIRYLDVFASGLTGFPDILKTLLRSIGPEGTVLDTASFVLADLRERMRRLELRIRKQLEEMVRDERVAVFLHDDFITKRSGRWVIPVRMDSKGQVAGVVHDVSNSGETAFVEPLAIINLTNELENLSAEAKAEEIRILKEITASVRRLAPEIGLEFGLLTDLDLLNCISRFAVSLDMKIPEINDSGMIRLNKARHPLLDLSLGKSGRCVVPLDVELGGEATAMIITGSNAGGKTIAIKTIGLLTLMALSGMPVPAGPASTFPVVRDVLADIGDEQSIDANLSTFSAHMSKISYILARADGQTLVLIDELGTGTDPDEGGALACAVLKELRGGRAIVFATTHLSDIKGFVHRSEGMINASMDFDQKTFTPLYTLRVGDPGQSHAIETARRFGLPERVIASARELIGRVKTDFDGLLEDMHRKREEHEKAIQLIAEEKARVEGLRLELQQKIGAAETAGKEALSKALQEASGIVIETRRRMNELLEGLKKAEKTGRRAILKEAEDIRRSLAEKSLEFRTAAGDEISPEDVSAGDIVYVRTLGYDARVIKVMPERKRLRVLAANAEIELSFGDVALRKGKTPDAKGIVRSPERTEEPVTSRINLVGLRVDEALSRIEPFLNDAALAGLAEVTVIHGIGRGLLARAVREHLEGHPLVKTFRTGDRSEGGAGVTVITLV